MGDKKNIDRIFQEKFKDFEVFPEAHVWKGIEKELVKKKKRSVVPLWLRFAGAAAILIAFISVGSWFYNNNDATENSPNTITNTDNLKEDKNLEKEQQPDKDNGPFDKIQTEKTLITTQQEPNQQNPTIQHVTQKYKGVHNAYKETKNNNVEFVENLQKPAGQTQSIDRNYPKIVEQPQEIEQTDLALTDVDQQSKNQKKDLIEEVREQESIEELLETKTKKWSIGSTTGPVYMNSLEGSPIDPSLVNNSKSSKGSLSYGIKINYKLSDKFSVQTAIQNVDLAYSTKNVAVIVTSSLLDQSNTNINFNIKGATAQVLSNNVRTSQVSEVSQIPFRKKTLFDSSGSLNQRLSYVEVPLEVTYALVQKKFEVDLVGGFSTYFLYDNEVSINSFDKKIPLGEASNVNNLNFSGNVGIDLNYNISPNLFINTSPMLKYQLNTYSEKSGGFKPYFFGIYAGLNYRF